jgi:hypothetical protein
MMHSRDRHHAAALTASLSLPRWYETAAELGLISEGRKSTHTGRSPEGAGPKPLRCSKSGGVGPTKDPPTSGSELCLCKRKRLHVAVLNLV